MNRKRMRNENFFFPPEGSLRDRQREKEMEKHHKEEKMKKAAALFLAASMICTSLAGCAQTETTESVKAETEKNVAAESTEKGEEKNAETAEAGGSIVFIATQLGDMSFNDNGWDGVQKIGETYGYETRVVETGMDSSKYENMFLDICDSDADYIIAQSGNGWGDIVFKYAADYPDKKFVVFDASTESEVPADNILCVAYKAYEGAYLTGVVCALMSESGMIAAGANRDNPAINDFFTGFISGAVEADPDIKVSIAYNSVPGDAAVMREIAASLYNSGVDIMFSVAGAAGLGIFQAAIDQNKLAVGVDSDQYLTYSNSESPELAEVIMTSMVKNIGGSLMTVFEEIHAGTAKWGELQVLGIAEGGVSLADNENYQKLVPEEIRNTVTEYEEKIKAGEIKVPSYYDFAEDQEFRDLVLSVAP